MKTQEIFDLAIKMGIEADLRGSKEVEKFLNRKKKKYEALSEREKDEFDIEALTNPYLDSRIHNIAEDKEIKKVLSGIDTDTAELLLAKQLGVDLVISHHPVGKGLSYLGDVMEMQADIYNQYGVPINIAEALNYIKIGEVS
ncbi:MAG TPA: NGG1p interacting factor NIF3, partial [Candidatus Pacearchaeota archaeon]|nr:NGG1p interacting factor NIF3 [Candidatus Pacearchaeota archaeon]